MQAKSLGALHQDFGANVDLFIPCAMQNDVHMEDAKNIVESGCKFYCEGANMPTTNDALVYLMDKMIAVGPSKAANAGGVACSCIEMGQNAGHTVFQHEARLCTAAPDYKEYLQRLCKSRRNLFWQ